MCLFELRLKRVITSLNDKTKKNSEINLIKNKIKEIIILLVLHDSRVINKGYPVLFVFTFLLYFPYHSVIISSKKCFDCTSVDISSKDDNLTGLSSVLLLITPYSQLNDNEEYKFAGYTIFGGVWKLSLS